MRNLVSGLFFSDIRDNFYYLATSPARVVIEISDGYFISCPFYQQFAAMRAVGMFKRVRGNIPEIGEPEPELLCLFVDFFSTLIEEITENLEFFVLFIENLPEKLPV